MYILINKEEQIYKRKYSIYKELTRLAKHININYKTIQNNLSKYSKYENHQYIIVKPGFCDLQSNRKGNINNFTKGNNT